MQCEYTSPPVATGALCLSGHLLVHAHGVAVSDSVGSSMTPWRGAVGIACMEARSMTIVLRPLVPTVHPRFVGWRQFAKSGGPRSSKGPIAAGIAVAPAESTRSCAMCFHQLLSHPGLLRCPLLAVRRQQQRRPAPCAQQRQAPEQLRPRPVWRRERNGSIDSVAPVMKGPREIAH